MDICIIAESFKDAVSAHGRLTMEVKPSIDALFVAAYLLRTGKRNTIKIGRTPPVWFAEKVRALESHHATAATVMHQLGQPNASIPECKQCGMWLTSMGYKKRKTNGRTLFVISN